MLEQLRNRSPTAQAALLRAQKSKLLSVALRILDSQADAETLVADLFADFFFKYVDHVRSEKAISSYLRIMVIRRARRSRERQGLTVSYDDETGGDHSDTYHAEVDDTLDRGSYLVWLGECMKNLGQRAHLLLKLHYGDDELSYSQVGAYLKCSKQAVGKNMAKTLETLRRCIDAREQAELARKRS